MEANKRTGWKWRDGELNVREYNKLASADQKKYIEEIKSLKISRYDWLNIVIWK